MDYDKLIAPAAEAMRPSGIRKFFDLAAEMPECISLGVGEPDFKTPWAVREAGIESLEHGRTRYTSNAGLKELRAEVARYLERRMGLHYDPLHEVLITVGGSEAIDMCIRTLVQPGDEVIIPEPCFVCYEPITTLSGGVPVHVPCRQEDEFRLRPEALKAAITPKTKLLIMPFPNNPTGAAYTRDQLKAWVDYAKKNDAIILYDAAYECFISDENLARSIFEIEGARECAIEICSFSKIAGFTGTRCGYTVVPKELEREGMNINKLWLRRQTTKFNGVPYVVQRAAAAVFTESGMAEIQQNLDYYRKNAKVIADALDECGVWYCGGKNSPYIWLRCPGNMKSWEFFDWLLENCGVVGTPGVGFGECGEGYFRLTAFGDAEKTKTAAERIKTAIKAL